MNLFVSNLGDQITDESLRATFATHGSVQSARIIPQRGGGFPQGCAFVDMPDDTEAAAAMERLNGAILNGRRLMVEKARAQVHPAGS